MNILVYGAGVIGQIYAARLHMAGQNVTLLARGQQAISLRQHGITLDNLLTGEHLSIHLQVVEYLDPEDAYDLILVTVRMDQVESVLPVLAANKKIPSILFMLNNPNAPTQLTQVLGTERVLLGFPGVGGTRQEQTVRYVMIRQQPTTLGEIHGKSTSRLRQIAAAFKAAGFPLALCTNMEAWLKTHAVFITCVSAAIIMEGGDSIRLGQSRKSIVLMIRAIQEGFVALQARGVSITPNRLKVIFLRMPLWFAATYWQRALQTTLGTLAIAPHAKVARAEMSLLAKAVLDMARATAVPTPTLQQVLSFLA